MVVPQCLTEVILTESDDGRFSGHFAERKVYNTLKKIYPPWVTSLTLLNLHRDINIDIPDVIDEFARRHPRRMELGDILAEWNINLFIAALTLVMLECYVIDIVVQPALREQVPDTLRGPTTIMWA